MYISGPPSPRLAADEAPLLYREDIEVLINSLREINEGLAQSLSENKRVEGEQILVILRTQREEAKRVLPIQINELKKIFGEQSALKKSPEALTAEEHQIRMERLETLYSESDKLQKIVQELFFIIDGEEPVTDLSAEVHKLHLQEEDQKEDYDINMPSSADEIRALVRLGHPQEEVELLVKTVEGQRQKLQQYLLYLQKQLETLETKQAVVREKINLLQKRGEASALSVEECREQWALEEEAERLTKELLALHMQAKNLWEIREESHQNIELHLQNGEAILQLKLGCHDLSLHLIEEADPMKKRVVDFLVTLLKQEHQERMATWAQFMADDMDET